MALSDKAQAIVVFASGFLMTVGAATIPAVLNVPSMQWIPEVLFFCGTIGLALKEAAGTSSPHIPDVVSLPSLPLGFSLSAAKAAGDTVYEDASGDVVILNGGVYSDIYGNKLSPNALPTTSVWTQL